MIFIGSVLFALTSILSSTSLDGPDEADASELVVPAGRKGKEVQTRIQDFQSKNKPAPTTIAAKLVKGDLKMTMAQFFRRGVVLTTDESESDRESTASDGHEVPSTVFLEDLETYKAYL
jgi:hypothetical protein